MPDFQTIMLPFLKLLADGHAHRMQDVTDRIAEQFSLSDSERSEVLSSGQRRLSNRVAWARTYMLKAGLVESPSRGAVRITTRGRAALAAGPKRVDMKFLSRYPEYVAFR